jgi:stage V sporulation protein G
MIMKVTEVRIRPVNDEFVKAYASICFDDCFLVHDIRVIKGPTGLIISFLIGRKARVVSGILPFRPTLKRGNMIEQAVLAEYEKVVAGSGG